MSEKPHKIQHLNPSEPTGRREFLNGAIASAAGLAVGLLGSEQNADAQQTCPSSTNCTPTIGQELTAVGEIKSGADGFLRGLVTCEGDLRSVTYYAGGNYFCKTHLLRGFHGYQGFALDESKRVTKRGVASPGPTFRAKVGDTIQILFLNRINKRCYQETAMSGERAGCEITKNAAGQEVYPQSARNPAWVDKYPDCFRVSNTTNLHYHGTHVTPGGFGDNVLIGVVPNRIMPTASEIQACMDFYKLCKPWDSDPFQWRASGSPAERAKWLAFQNWYNQANANLAKLDPEAVKANQVSMRNGEWPQYWPGYYPYYFTIPKFEQGKAFPAAGQCPGTHWYHAHQHGSTSIQLLNGMAGAFVITSDDYDGRILTLGGGTPAQPKIKEKLLIMQLFAEVTNLMAGGAGQNPQSLTVNGQLTPTVTMKRGEVQWWRLVNASIQSHGISNYFFMEKSQFDALKPDGSGTIPMPPPGTRGVVPLFRTLARDGVQFAWENYRRRKDDVNFQLSPANRIDFLIQAPSTEGDHVLVFWPAVKQSPPNGNPPQVSDPLSQLVLRVHVSGAASGENTEWYDPAPTNPPANYPVFPTGFLNDIQPEEIRIRRTVEFSMIRLNTQQPVVMIDGVQFNEGIINKVMLQGDAEEWTLVNTSQRSVMHPFHIHINPFQIVEVFDPSYMDTPQTWPNTFVWQDNIAIPAGFYKPIVPNPNPATLSDYKFVPGHIKIRHRFLDFAGKYVLHCHILGHEDRGMMQLIEVIPNKTVVKHH